MSNGSISKKKKSDVWKRHKENEKEEEEDQQLVDRVYGSSVVWKATGLHTCHCSLSSPLQNLTSHKKTYHYFPKRHLSFEVFAFREHSPVETGGG
jgi:hypothetical protein